MKKYWVYFKADLQKMLEYRADNLIYSLSNIVAPLVSLGMWLAIASSGANLSYSKPEVILYFLLAIFIKSITSTWADYFLEGEILKGRFSISLIRPFTVIEEFAVHNISEKLFRIGFVIIILAILSVVLVQDNNIELNITPLSLTLFIISLFLASLLNFFIDIIVGLSTFWFHETELMKGIIDFMNTLFSGKIIPLIFMPVVFFNIALYLPFRYTFSLPIEILMNKVIGPGVLFAFIMQAVWLIIIYAIYKIVYFKGVKLYQGYGA